MAESTDDRVDARVERTRRALQQAALELARAGRFDDATVADITDAAGVNRSSYYQHYDDRDSLLADAIEAAEIEAAASAPTPTSVPAQLPPSMIAALRHFETDADLYRRLLGERGSPIVAARIRSRFEAQARAGVISSGTTAFEGLPIDIVAAGIAGSCLAVIQAWLELDPRPSIETAADWVWRVLVGPGEPISAPERDGAQSSR
ncbi:transcriptional regulator, TetR family [Agromyces sp. CF514]|uniref:TetR/AcrR family transcriptional regulator n=1 Tax=Agromyces sp. CF514 TaxID=1881031 RepID=UPI0008F3F97A|nr:TetR/AcrR family transcriptional regulator [Agromyces sp. CF514]SFR70610.1 transcriptional regulator, TetR family [Agromyces sp. CF514]